MGACVDYDGGKKGEKGEGFGYGDEANKVMMNNVE